MSKTEYVLVPKKLLEQLEEDRKQMYRMAAQQPLSESMLVSYNLTSVMWKLGNTVFKPYNVDEPLKMSIETANTYINKASIKVKEVKGYRFGQALWNSLPKELIECEVGTERDFFYWEDRSAILRAFYTNFVEEGDKPNYDTSVVPDVDYKALFEELLEVTENSDGVTGLHNNGDIASWDELENNNWLPLLKEWKENQHE